ncbi:MAG: hypothetical protein AB7I59_13155 [Geminicoccaceae bacterium]
MKKMHLLIAALHASALALTAGASHVHAQDAQEIRAYMEALRAGTAEAMAGFLTRYPSSALPGSEMGASIAAGIDPATAAVGGGGSSPADQGWGGGDQRSFGGDTGRENAGSRDSRIGFDDGIY